MTLASSLMAAGLAVSEITFVVPGNFVLVVLPPEETSCRDAVATIDYPATGQRIPLQKFLHFVGTFSIEVTPALRRCIFSDGFES